MYYNYGGKGIRCDLTVKQAWTLWVIDGAKSMGSPSIDRIDPKGNYTFSNVQFIELEENLKRRNEDKH